MIKKFLHVGCGQAKKENTTQVLKEDSWDEVRLDIDSSVNPDIIGDILDLNNIDDNSYDAVFSSHNIEHVFMHEVKIALSEFKRVLKDDGFLLLCCPDISKACEMIASGKVGEKLYDSPAGPIFPLELLYGHNTSIAAGKTYMAHKTGFTIDTLKFFIGDTGFKSYIIAEDNIYNLWALAYKNKTFDDAVLTSELKLHFGMS